MTPSVAAESDVVVIVGSGFGSSAASLLSVEPMYPSLTTVMHMHIHSA